MERRVTELANSPTQLHAAFEMQFLSAQHSQGLSPLSVRSDFPGSSISMAGSRPSSASPSDGCSESAHSSDDFMESQASLPYPVSDKPEESPSEAWGDQDDPMDIDQGEGRFGSFLHKTTFMTESSANTTGTFRNHLQGYAEPYVQVVKRLVKRFTSPGLGQPGTSRQHDLCIVWNEDWIAGNDVKQAFDHCIVLPGDFLREDFYHQWGNFPAVQDAWPNDRIYWVTPHGLTEYAASLLTVGLTVHDAMVHDCFHNTVLHFLAACAPPKALIDTLAGGNAAPIINARNTAGQTFMHLLNIANGWSDYDLWQLVIIVHHLGFDVYALDCYGRSMFHILGPALCAPLQQCAIPDLDARRYNRRDAFGHMPRILTQNLGEQQQPSTDWPAPAIPHDIPSPALDPERSNNPAVSQESQLVQNIRVSFTNPHHEDQFGRNGLHCLAMATLSVGGIAEKHSLKDLVQDTAGPSKSRRRGDSSQEVLSLRLSLLRGLLSAGLDPNHRDVFGNTPLMAFVAALPEDDEYKIGPKMLKTLISKGVDVDARNRRGETALHIAVRFHRKLAVRVLTDAGANVHAKTAIGHSLLEMCDAHLTKDPEEYGKYSACRAWLSGKAGAVQRPTLWQEWTVPEHRMWSRQRRS